MGGEFQHQVKHHGEGQTNVDKAGGLCQGPQVFAFERVEFERTQNQTNNDGGDPQVGFRGHVDSQVRSGTHEEQHGNGKYGVSS